jgi:predicted MFS family arabinose efflux permease
LQRSLVILFAVSCGMTAANLYYAQPLLADIAHTFHTGPATASLVVTAAQVGYGLGLAFLVPLGDLVRHRTMIPVLLGGTVLALVAAASAPRIAVLAGALAAVGVTSVVAQVLVPFAAHLASDDERGRVVGTVMSGLLIGILLARTVSGVLAQVAGWRAIYMVAAGWTVLLGVALRRFLPFDEPTLGLRYRELLLSVVALAREEPVLRRRALYGALTFAAFNILWTSLAYLLSGPPYYYSKAVIGLFGLLGAGGALCATVAGRLADRGLERWWTGIFLATVAGSAVLLALGGHRLWALMAGIVLLDLGAQGAHILNQHTIFRLRPDARSRLNTVYMVSYFIGGALGSTLTGVAYATDRWDGVSTLAGAMGLVALFLWAAGPSGLRTQPPQAVHADGPP